MAYSTGSFNTLADLKTIVENFATTNGWTLASGVLSKGQSHIKLTNPGTDRLHITGANSADFLTEPCPFGQVIYILPADLPATYYLFYQTNPDIIVCVVNYDVTRIQVMMFGEISKMDASAYVGGNFFFASRHENYYTYIPTLWHLTDSEIAVGQGSPFSDRPGPFMPFCTKSSLAYLYNGIHIKIDGAVWDGTDTGTAIKVFPTDATISSYFRSPNQWDNQAHLVPFQLQYAMANNLYAYLGHIEHIRLIKINNYNIGDIVDLSPDKWKVFPWVQKELTYPNGRTSTSLADEQAALQASGGLGFAVRYDGP